MQNARQFAGELLKSTQEHIFLQNTLLRVLQLHKTPLIGTNQISGVFVLRHRGCNNFITEKQLHIYQVHGFPSKPYGDL